MRNHVNLCRGNLKDLLEKLRRVLAHHDEPIGELRKLDHHAVLVGVRFAQHGMKSSDDRHAEFAQQLQDVASGGPPKIPYSCCTQTRSTLVKLRNSAARS